jgi:predicted amidohydrolase
MPRSHVCVAFLFGCFVLGGLPAKAAPTNLLTTSADWKVATPFKSVGLKFTAEDKNPAPQLSITAGGNARDIGGWVRPLPNIEKGRRYHLEAAFTVAGIDHPQRHVWAFVTTGNREFLEFVTADKVGGRYRLTLDFTAEKEHANADLRFYLADTARGSVTWDVATLEDITATYQPRVAKLAAISGKPKNPKTPQEAVEFYARRIDEVRGLGVDLVCLPENINTDEVEGDKWEMLEPIPGPTTQRLAEKAREHRVYIAASIAERADDLRHNTAVLIDRQGNIVAKYRKSHLTMHEHLLSGITEGDDFVVHQADFGKVGLMVCWDHHFPEVARILALKGAEILAMPNAADAREGGTLWESAMRMRAVDNHVFIATAVNFGRSMIVGPDGNILAKNAKVAQEPGGVVHAVCALGDSVANYSGQPINKRYLQVRRPEIYETLLRDLDGDLKANVRENGRTLR